MSEFISICPKCRQQIMCDTTYIGQRVACPLCLQEIGIAAPMAPLPGAAESPGQATPNPGRRTPLLMITVAGAILVGGITALAARKFSQNHASGPAPASEPALSAAAPVAATPLVPASPAALQYQGRVISWHLDDYGTVNGSSVNYNGLAGVVPVNNWNDSFPENRTTQLLDDAGNATSLNLKYGSVNTFRVQSTHPGQDADGTYNKELLNSYLNAGPAARVLPLTNSYVTLSGIPYARYDVYVYLCSDAAERLGNVTDGVITYDFSTLGRSAINRPNALFRPTTDQGGLFPPANYAIFRGETARSLTIKANAMGGNDEWLGIAGFQVVDTSAAR